MCPRNSCDSTGNPVTGANWIVVRNPADNPTLASLGAYRSANLYATQGASNLLYINSVGSFSIVAFVDQTGQYQQGDPACFYNIVLCSAGYVSDNSFATPAFTTAGTVGNWIYQIDGVGQNVYKDAFVVQYGGKNPLGGLQLNATIALVGGGGDGTLGLDRVFPGWMQNCLYASLSGVYLNNHSAAMYLTDSNPPGVPPAKAVQNYFCNNSLLASMAPPISSTNPVLDAFGDTSGGAVSYMDCGYTVGGPGPTGLGETITVKSADYPPQALVLWHPKDLTNSSLSSFGNQLNFTPRLMICTQSNSAVPAGSTAHPGSTLYMCTEELSWCCQSAYSFTWTNGNPSVTQQSLSETGPSQFIGYGTAQSIGSLQTPAEVMPPIMNYRGMSMNATQ